MMKLVKIDKNGTKYYEGTCKCGRCLGSGYISYFGWNDGGRCFACGGSGVVRDSYKEYTPEYQQKLEAKRIAQAIKKSDDTNRRFLKENGFNEKGEAWIVLGDTFAIKDELKLSGARFTVDLGWHFDQETSYPCVKVIVDDICHKNDVNEYCVNNDIREYIQTLKDKNTPKEECTSEYVGQVGDKVSLKIETFKCMGAYESMYGTMFIYQFKDNLGNIYIWKTTSSCGDNPVYVTGTIKDHSEYKGMKQNILSRCKISQTCC